MPPTYRIRAWSETFLTDKTRGRTGRLKYLMLPVRLHDPDYLVLAKKPASLGVWMALIEAAGTLEARDGVLRRRDGRPLTTSELSAMTGIPESALDAGIQALTEVGWLVSESFGTIPNDSELAPPKQSGVEQSGEERRGAEQTIAASAASVLDHYRTYHPRFVGGDKERRLVSTRLKDGWTPDDLKAAIDGNHRSPFHCGDNERGLKYHKLDLILRDSAHVQQFLDIPTNGSVPKHVARPQNVAAAQSWLERHSDDPR